MKFLCFRILALGLAVTTVCFSYTAYAFSTSIRFENSFKKTSSTLYLTTTSSANTDLSDVVDGKNELIPLERYVVSNRFAIRSGKETKFENRWATRKSRLASLPGFKYFHLMRRVTLEEGIAKYDEGNKKDKTCLGNYVSFTVFEDKDSFTAWRTGEAFKEAHGGTSIGAFVSTLIKSAFIMRGGPRPAFYEGILAQSNVPESVPETKGGWRVIETNGEVSLPAECFVACNQFFVPSENAAAFEEKWATRDSKLKELNGFVAFLMMRRDSAKMDDLEPTYTSTTIWKDRESFDVWRSGSSFKKAHDSNSSTKKEAKGTPPAKPLWSKPPSPIFYEGSLVITSSEGL